MKSAFRKMGDEDVLMYENRLKMSFLNSNM